MNELVQLLYAFLSSEEAPELYEDEGEPLEGDKALEVAQLIAEKIIASGWPSS